MRPFADLSGVSDLASHLCVKRSLVQEENALFSLLEFIDEFAVGDHPRNMGLKSHLLISLEVGGLVGPGEVVEEVLVELLSGGFVGLARLFLRLFFQQLEAGEIHLEGLVLGDQQNFFDGEPVGFFELEGVLAADLFRPPRQVDDAVQNIAPPCQGSDEGLFLGRQDLGDPALPVFQLGEVFAHRRDEAGKDVG